MSQVEVKPVEENTPASTSLLDRFEELTNQVKERAYQLFEARGRKHGRQLDDWCQAEGELLTACACDVKATDDQLVIEVDVPGFQAEDLKVNVLPDTVIVEGNASQKKSRKDEAAEYSESSSQTLFQRIPVPETVLVDKAKRHYKKTSFVSRCHWQVISTIRCKPLCLRNLWFQNRRRAPLLYRITCPPGRVQDVERGTKCL